MRKPVEIASETSTERLLEVAADFHSAGENEAALVAFERATLSAPECIPAWHAIATISLALNLPRKALQACNRALALAPENRQSIFNVAVVLSSLGDYAAALHCYAKVLVEEPGHYGSLRNRPILLARIGRIQDAIVAARESIQMYPQDAWLHYNYADILLGANEFELAERAYQNALLLQSDLHCARLGLSLAVAAQGRIEDACEIQVGALSADPTLLRTYNSPLASDIYSSRHRSLSPARICAHSIYAELRDCRWTRYEEIGSLFSKLVNGEPGDMPLGHFELPFIGLHFPIEGPVHMRLAIRTADSLGRQANPQRIIRSNRPRDTRITVGYISGDFKPHPVAWLMGKAFARHDRERFRVLAYSTHKDEGSPEREQVKRDVDVFRDISGLPDEAAAQLIANDGVDILVDLSGYGFGARPEILAWRPAPLQVNYLGYPATSGAPWIDYAMLDRGSLPQDERQYWTEKIAYLPHSAFHCEYPPSRLTPKSRADYGLPEGAFVFCALHWPRKLDPRAFSVWLELLSELPRTVLWLIAEDKKQIDNLRTFAEQRNIKGGRLIFGQVLPYFEHLARYRAADAFLDTFVSSGITTVLDALGADLPSVCLEGKVFHQRASSTMLRAHGMPELVAASAQEYKEIATRLVNDPQWREALCHRLKHHGRTHLFCPEVRIREIENAFETMWEHHRGGSFPRDFDVSEVS